MPGSWDEFLDGGPASPLPPDASELAAPGPADPRAADAVRSAIPWAFRDGPAPARGPRLIGGDPAPDTSALREEMGLS